MCYSRDYDRMIEAKKAEEARMEQQRRAEQIDKMLDEANKQQPTEATPVKDVAPAK